MIQVRSQGPHMGMVVLIHNPSVPFFKVGKLRQENCLEAHGPAGLEYTVAETRDQVERGDSLKFSPDHMWTMAWVAVLNPPLPPF